MGKQQKKRMKFLLLDGYSLAFRAFYALPEDLQTSDGTHTNAVYGFTAMLIKLLQEEKPDRIACCFDMAGPLERAVEYAEYKSNRTEAPEHFSPQVPLILEVLKVLRIPVFGVPGHEADDIIACIAKRAAGDDMDVRIVTGDRDFFQLASDRIHVLYNRRGITDIVEMDPKAVEARYGVPPSKYVDLKALEGDTSDNLPGVPGVGTKTAAKLVQKYGSAEAAVAHAAEQTPKLAANLAAHGEQVAINKRLSILAEVPLEGAEPDGLAMGAWDLDEVKKLFGSLEFRTLLERLLADLPDAAEGQGDPFELDLEIVQGGDAVSDLADRLRRGGELAVDVAAPRPRRPPLSLAVAWGDKVAFVPLSDGRSDRDLGPVAGVMADASIGKVAYGARALLLSLGAAGISVGGLRLDARIGAYLLDPGAASYELEAIARKYAGRELQSVAELETASGDQAALDLGGEADDQARAEEGGLRALAIAEVARTVEEQLRRAEMWDLYETIEHPLIDVLTRMEQTGVKVDLEYLAGIGRDLSERIEVLEQECYELAGEKLNLGSPPQLRVLLYEKLGLKTTRRTKTGLSTDARALQQLRDQHPFVPKLLEYRELTKLKNTYIDALPPLVDSDGRVHTTYDQTVAATGRLSSTDPNLMNIPIRTDLGRKIRRAFIPAEGCFLLSADYSQIELRVMAHLSEDPILVEVFARREDVHAATAGRIYGLPPDELGVKHRSVAKMVNYGLAYGMGAPGLAERLNVAIGEAQEIMEAYFEQFAGIKQFLDRVVTQAYADGYTTTMFGRRRYLPELGSGNPRVRSIGERQALNAPIQGSAADIMKLAMVRVDAALAAAGLRTKMILTVHDELVFEVPHEEKEKAQEIVEQEMTGACDLAVPLEVDVSGGSNWADAKS